MNDLQFNQLLGLTKQIVSALNNSNAIQLAQLELSERTHLSPQVEKSVMTSASDQIKERLQRQLERCKK